MSNKKVTDRDYLYLSALLRARETHMLTNEIAERMIDASSFDEAAKLLSECGYPDMSGLSAKELEKRLVERRRELFTELENIIPEKEIVEIFRIRFDYHNAKVVIKAEGVGTQGDYLLSESGRFSSEKLSDSYINEEYSDFSEVFRRAISEAKSTLARTENPQLADFILDKAYFTELNAAASAITSQFPRAYVRTLADCANLKAVVRTLRLGKDMDFLRQALVPGGSYDEASIIQIVSAGEGVSQLFNGTILSEAAQKGAAAISGGSLTDFEKECDNAIVRLLTDTRFMSFDAGVVVAYLAAVENEITSVRMILTGKLSGVKPEKLRERLRESYA